MNISMKVETQEDGDMRTGKEASTPLNRLKKVMGVMVAMGEGGKQQMDHGHILKERLMEMKLRIMTQITIMNTLMRATYYRGDCKIIKERKPGVSVIPNIVQNLVFHAARKSKFQQEAV